MAAPIPPMLKYSVVHNFLISLPILIKFVSKFMFCKELYFETQYALRLRCNRIHRCPVATGYIDEVLFPNTYMYIKSAVCITDRYLTALGFLSKYYAMIW